MTFKFAERMATLPPYLFAEINKMKDEMRKKGVDVIDLGIGDPDVPTSPIIVEQMQKEVAKPHNHNYPPYDGLPEFRKQISVFFKERYGVELDPDSEVLPIIGSKEAIFHVPFIMLDDGDWVLVPDPGYPVYSIATRLCGGNVYNMPLLRENAFLPELEKIPSDIAAKAKVIFINYPNNPTSAGATEEFFGRLLDFAKKNEIVVCHDSAYSEVYYGDKPPQSFLEVDKKKEVSLEFHSLSKTFNMTGWRVGFAAGNSELVSTLGKLKTNMDSGIFKAVQRASIAGLKNWKKLTSENRRLYAKRAKQYTQVLKDLGFDFKEPDGTFYFWIEVPKGYKSKEFVKKLLEKTGVVVTPGIGMGPSGDRYFRISLTAPDDRLAEGIKRLKNFDMDEI